MRRFAIVLAMAMCPPLSGCSPASTPPTATAASLTALEARPLHLPTINPEVQSCPLTAVHRADSLAPLAGDSNMAVGSGPVFPIMYGPSPSTAAQPFSAVPGGWHYAKVPWFAQPGYQGPVVLRGARVDGSDELRFDSHPTLTSSFELTSSSDVFHPAAGWRGWPTGILVRSRGCYAIQIDGTGFSTVVVFLALVDVPPTPAAHAVPGGCASTTMYQGSPPEWLADAAGGVAAPVDVPYFSAPSALIGGFVFGYPLRGGTQGNRANKILWAVATARNGAPLVIQGHPQGRTVPVVSLSVPDNSSPGEIYPSIVDVPSAGCWAFTLQWGTVQADIQLRFAP